LKVFDENIKKFEAMTSLAQFLVLVITLICQWNFCDKLPFDLNGLFVSVQWGAFYLFIANFFATQIIGGAKELVVLL